MGQWAFSSMHLNILIDIMYLALLKMYLRVKEMIFMFLYFKEDVSLFLVCFCSLSLHSRDWHMVSLFSITSYFPVSPSAKTVNLLTRCTYSQLLLQESRPNEESLDKMRGMSQTTGAWVHHCSFTGITLYVSNHIKDSWFWFILFFLDQLLVTVWQLSLLRQAGVWLRMAHAILTGYSHLLYPLWW